MLLDDQSGMKAMRNHRTSMCRHRVTKSGSINAHLAANATVAERPKINKDDNTNHWRNFAVD